MKINKNKMFSRFPKVSYLDHKIRDFTRHARILTRVRENDFYSSDYYVQENDTPQSLAQDFYGDPNLFWVLLNLNDKIDPWNDWPMNYWSLVRYTIFKYDLKDDPDDPDYENKDDLGDTFLWGGRSDNLWFFADELSTAHLNVDWANSEAEFIERADKMSYFDYENILNDEKRYIRIIRPDRISEIVEEFHKEIA